MPDSNLRTDPVGVFDSGVGGLSVLGEAVRQLPGEDFIYYGDTGNAPYGTKDPDTVRHLAFDVVEKLRSQRVKAIVIACNTATAEAAKELRAYYSFPIIGMEPALKPASELKEPGLRLVLATPGTLGSEKYARLYARFGRNAVSLPCPGLMEFVEAGDRGSEQLRAYLSTLFAPYIGQPVAAVVLGCTHYPFIKPLIQSFFPAATRVLDGNAGTVRQLRRVLDREGLLNPGDTGTVSLQTSGTEQTLSLMKAMFIEAKEMTDPETN
ncbi:MAG: glutamate racemase [Clostridia bacterium]|nr:glutamate racemase [Clostridia bacterium]